MSEPSLRRLNITRALTDRLTRPWSMRRADMRALFVSAFQETPADFYLTDDDLNPTDPDALTIVNGIAIIAIQGVMMKGAPSYYVRLGYATDTDNVREQVISASADNAVRAILLVIHSPGGEVYGLDQLSDAVFNARGKKPVHAYIEDLGASAAYMVASQATTISANRTAMVGSIGTYMMIEDMYRCLTDMGIDTRIVSSALLKGGDSSTGQVITEAELRDAQRIVDAFNTDFTSVAARGRGIGEDVVNAWATGQVWLSPEAQTMGLIDAIGNADDAVRRLASPEVNGRAIVPAESEEGAETMKLFGRRKPASDESAEATQAVKAEEEETQSAEGESPKAQEGETGGIKVTLAPQEAVDAGAMFVVDEGEPQASGTTVEGLAPGTHRVSYTEVEGYTAPPAEDVEVVAGAITEIEREYAAAETTEEPETPASEPEAQMTAAQALELAKTVGAEKALAAQADGKSVEQALTEHAAELQAQLEVKTKAIEESEALGSKEAVAVVAADAKPDGKSDGKKDRDDLVDQAAAGMKFIKK